MLGALVISSRNYSRTIREAKNRNWDSWDTELGDRERIDLRGGKLSGKVSGDRGALRAITLALMWEFLDLQDAHGGETFLFHREIG